MPCIWESVELFSWKTTFHKGHSEVCLSYIRLLPGLLGMWSSMKITLFQILLFCRSLLVWIVIEMKVVSMIIWRFLFIEVCLYLFYFNVVYMCKFCNKDIYHHATVIVSYLHDFQTRKNLNFYPHIGCFHNTTYV